MTTTQRLILIALALIIFIVSQNLLKPHIINGYTFTVGIREEYLVRLISIILPGWLIYKAAGKK